MNIKRDIQWLMANPCRTILLPIYLCVGSIMIVMKIAAAQLSKK